MAVFLLAVVVVAVAAVVVVAVAAVVVVAVAGGPDQQPGSHQSLQSS